VTGVQTCALPISALTFPRHWLQCAPTKRDDEEVGEDSE